MNMIAQYKPGKSVRQAQTELLDAIREFRKAGGEIGFHSREVFPSKGIVEDYKELKVSRAKMDTMEGYVIFSALMNPVF